MTSIILVNHMHTYICSTCDYVRIDTTVVVVGRGKRNFDHR